MSNNLPTVRRVVTHHTLGGISNIQNDSQVVFQPTSLVPGANIAPIWRTLDGLPTGNNNTFDDGAKRQINPQENFGLTPTNGSNAQITELAPGAITPNHRTSSLDYNILLAGELVLVMEDGSETKLTQPGDSVIMKGGMHLWKNPSTTQWCRWVTVLIPADPVVIDGNALPPMFK